MRGTTIAELGAGNRPIDMVLYKKDGNEYLLMSNTSRGVMKIPTKDFATAAGITTPIQGTAGIAYETVKSMTGIQQLDLLDADHSIRRRKDGRPAQPACRRLRSRSLLLCGLATVGLLACGREPVARRSSTIASSLLDTVGRSSDPARVIVAGVDPAHNLRACARNPAYTHQSDDVEPAFSASASTGTDSVPHPRAATPPTTRSITFQPTFPLDRGRAYTIRFEPALKLPTPQRRFRDHHHGCRVCATRKTIRRNGRVARILPTGRYAAGESAPDVHRVLCANVAAVGRRRSSI